MSLRPETSPWHKPRPLPLDQQILLEIYHADQREQREWSAMSEPYLSTMQKYDREWRGGRDGSTGYFDDDWIPYDSWTFRRQVMTRTRPQWRAEIEVRVRGRRSNGVLRPRTFVAQLNYGGRSQEICRGSCRSILDAKQKALDAPRAKAARKLAAAHFSSMRAECVFRADRTYTAWEPWMSLFDTSVFYRDLGGQAAWPAGKFLVVSGDRRFASTTGVRASVRQVSIDCWSSGGSCTFREDWAKVPRVEHWLPDVAPIDYDAMPSRVKH